MELERRDDVAVLRLRAGKANAMNTAMLGELNRLVDEAGRTARGLVLVGDGKAFSAGLDLPALVDLERPAMREFIDMFARAMIRVLRLDIPVVAAIDGHAIAGGCVLALQADVRLAARGAARIGLTETQLGIGLPAVVTEVLRIRVPPSSLVPIALEGRLLSPDEAHALGLVHDLVEPDALLDAAVARAATLAALPSPGVAHVKAQLRRPALDAMVLHGVAERERWLDTWFTAEARERITAAAARLRG
ncbi:MAG: enoyl-CoA hydratase/isomerase family protein [Kofleriaceae bacterium]|nr:enoyl-CoA hydratase/isomerase family protein [Myxococcales bacterium]MCB9559033.1 enoyl-CoA hydratase/isomerase family protein [Kofleriaceae bacterium]MCB9575310.1 enoyl-CoA hydratase/isomerase family protein [Kofleriaceae bacterium]